MAKSNACQSIALLRSTGRKYSDVVAGAHDLILHILEPSIQQRATMRDIAVHRWLQDKSQLDLGGRCVTPKPTESSGDVPLDGGIQRDADVNKENSDSSFNDADDSQIRSCSGNVSSHVTAEPSFFVTSSQRDGDVSCQSGSRATPPSSGICNRRIRDEDFTPLCNSGDRLPSSSGVSSTEIGENCRRTSLSDRSISTAGDMSDYSFRHTSAAGKFHGYLGTVCKPNADRVVVPSDVASPAAKGQSTTVAERARLPRSFSADSLELFSDRKHHICSADADPDLTCDKHLDSHNSEDDDDDDDVGEKGRHASYDFSDIDAVLHQIGSNGTDTEASIDCSSQVSSDSLEDAM